MKNIFNFLKPLTGIIILCFLAYYFSDIFLYFVFAVVLSLLGRPLVVLLKKIHIKKLYMGSVFAAILTIILMIMLFSVLLLVIVPLVSKQAVMVSTIDSQAVYDYFRKPIDIIYKYLIDYGILQSNETFIAFFEGQFKNVLDLAHFTKFFGNVISTTGSVFMAIFIVLFLTFFFLKEPHLLKNIIMAVTPEPYTKNMNIILSESRYLLTRYFMGLLIEISCMMILISVGLTILGVKNALVIGFLGGLMNVIPYLGPIIGAVIGVVLGIVSVLSQGQYDMVLMTSIIVIAVFACSNLIDNFLLQPMIYSKSVKAHPMEIFLIIILAGNVWGVVGMIAAIPVYTVIRIVAKQFLSHFKFVGELVKNMDIDIKQ